MNLSNQDNLEINTFGDRKKIQDIVADKSLDFTYMLGCLVDQQRFGISVDFIVEGIKQAVKDVIDQGDINCPECGAAAKLEEAMSLDEIHYKGKPVKRDMTAQMKTIYVAVEHNTDGSVIVCKEIADAIYNDPTVPELIRSYFRPTEPLKFVSDSFKEIK